MSLLQIARAVADYYSLTVKDIRGRSRKQDISRARQMFMYLARQHLDVSLKLVGRWLGGRCPATVGYAYTKIASEKECAEVTELEVSEIQAALGGVV